MATILLPYPGCIKMGQSHFEHFPRLGFLWPNLTAPLIFKTLRRL